MTGGSGPEIPERPFLWTSVLGVIRFGDGDGGEVAVSVIHAECVRIGHIAPSTLWPERDPETRAFLLARLAHIQRARAPRPPPTARPSDVAATALATVPAPLPLAIVRVRERPHWSCTPEGWRHRPWWKVVINTVLRPFQPQARKLVVYTRCEGGDDADPQRPPRVIGYGFGLVRHLSTRTPSTTARE